MQYIKEDIENMLRDYPKDEAKLTEIKLKREEYEERLNYAGSVYEESEKEVIESMQLKGQAYDSIHSNTNSISDKTSKVALSYNKEMNHINEEDRVYLEKKILECNKLEAELDKKIVRVKNMINQLSKEQKFIIKTYYLEKSKWDYVANEYYEEFNKPKSINQLLNIRDEAVKSMLDIINTGI